MQKRHGGEGISIAVSGDAGTAEGDFESCLLWSSRPGNELPVLTVVTNNGYGISVTHDSQHAAKHIAKRAEPYGIRNETIDVQTDPFRATGKALVQRSRIPHRNQAPGTWCRIPVQNRRMIYGYARVSTDGQSAEAQAQQLTAAGTC